MKYSKAVNVATFHANFETNFYYRFFRPFLYPLWNRLHGRVAVSPSAKSSISRYFPGNNVEIIPNGVDTKRFSPKGEKIKKFCDKKINILFTGRIEKRKGLIYLLQAYALLKKKHPEIRLIIVGRGPLEKELKKYVRDNSIEDVNFEGFVGINELPKYYKTAHIYSSPALFGESFGIVLLEAMAAGVPVVAFNISGYNDVVANNEDGLLAEPRDVHDLHEKLSLLVEHPGLIKEIGDRGYAKSKRFNWKIIAAKNIEYYKKLWKKRV
jgi:phosphatidylinositol alpha-mannosyltransferase